MAAPGVNVLVGFRDRRRACSVPDSPAGRALAVAWVHMMIDEFCGTSGEGLPDQVSGPMEIRTLD